MKPMRLAASRTDESAAAKSPEPAMFHLLLIQYIDIGAYWSCKSGKSGPRVADFFRYDLPSPAAYLILAERWRKQCNQLYCVPTSSFSYVKKIYPKADSAQ